MLLHQATLHLAGRGFWLSINIVEEVEGVEGVEGVEEVEVILKPLQQAEGRLKPPQHLKPRQLR